MYHPANRRTNNEALFTLSITTTIQGELDQSGGTMWNTFGIVKEIVVPRSRPLLPMSPQFTRMDQ
jgi:hypothetical protein